MSDRTKWRTRWWRGALAWAVFAQASSACSDDQSIEQSTSGGARGGRGGGPSDVEAGESTRAEAGSGGAATGGTAGASPGGGGDSDGGAQVEDCGPYRGEGGISSDPYPKAVEGAYCECDGAWTSCDIAPEEFCFGPPGIGCDPSFDDIVSSRVVQCSNGSYRECPDGRARIEFEYHSPARFEFEFEIETGLMLWGSAEPIEAYCSGFSGGPRPAIYSAKREHEPGSDEGCRSCPFGAAVQTGCLVTDGRLALPPDPTN